MRTLLSRISANAGSSLTAGGTLLAVGVAIGAIGLTEVSLVNGDGTSPLRNGWVQVGLVVGMIGAAWTIATFVLAMIATKKHADFHRTLGHALNDGEHLANNWGSLQEIRTWGQQTADLIHAGLGDGEDRLFLGDWESLGEQDDMSRPRPEGHRWLYRRLQRLMRLMDRMHSMHTGAGVKLPDCAYVSDADPRFATGGPYDGDRQ
jgi:hypothetical protein